MTSQRKLIHESCLLMALLIGAASGRAAMLVDDFNDGNDDGWTHFNVLTSNDNESWAPSIYEFTNGEYNLGTTGKVEVGTAHGIGASWDASEDPLYTNGLWQATVRSESVGTNVGMQLRGPEASEGGYSFITSVHGDLGVWDCTKTCTRLGKVAVGFTRGEDWMMKVEAVGDMLSAKMWPVGKEEPDDPQLQLQNDAHPSGRFALIAFLGSNSPVPERVNAFFDDISFTPSADCNGDGELSAADLSCVALIESRDAVLDALNTLPGDLDGNGDVSFGDFLMLSSNFGKDLLSYSDGNIDLEDGINFADFLLLSSNFGKTPQNAAAAVPEPTRLLMTCLACACLFQVRLRHARGDRRKIDRASRLEEDFPYR